MKQHVQETEVMRASNLLYVYARMYQMIHACRPVSVRVLRTAVCEWACWYMQDFNLNSGTPIVKIRILAQFVSRDVLK